MRSSPHPSPLPPPPCVVGVVGGVPYQWGSVQGQPHMSLPLLCSHLQLLLEALRPLTALSTGWHTRATVLLQQHHQHHCPTPTYVHTGWRVRCTKPRSP